MDVSMIALISIKKVQGLMWFKKNFFLKEATYAHHGCIIAFKTAIFVILK